MTADRPDHVRVPIVPPRSLLISMAVCIDHGFGWPRMMEDEATFKRRQEMTLSDMAKVYAEVVGRGYWKPERAGRYDDLAPTPATEAGHG